MVACSLYMLVLTNYCVKWTVWCRWWVFLANCHIFISCRWLGGNSL